MKNKKLCIRISENLLEIIHMKAKKANMTLTDYVTFACLEKQIFVIDGLDKVLKELDWHHYLHTVLKMPKQLLTAKSL